MTTAAEERIAAWRERYADEVAATAHGHDRAMAWWAGLGDDAFLEPDHRGGWQCTESGIAFADLFWGSEDATMAMEVIEVAGNAGESGRCCPGARKGCPGAAFYYALGVSDAARMPGSFGDFLIAADEAAAVLPELEAILAGPRRDELIERVGRWLDYAADGSASEAPEIVDGVLRVFREAAERRLGVAAVTACF